VWISKISSQGLNALSSRICPLPPPSPTFATIPSPFHEQLAFLFFSPSVFPTKNTGFSPGPGSGIECSCGAITFLSYSQRFRLGCFVNFLSVRPRKTGFPSPRFSPLVFACAFLFSPKNLLIRRRIRSSISPTPIFGVISKNLHPSRSFPLFPCPSFSTFPLFFAVPPV